MWILFGAISAFFDSLLNINAKKNTKKIDALVISWLWMLCASPIVIIPALVFGFAEIDFVFWQALAVRTVLDTIALILYVRALRDSQITLAQPMLGLTPVLVVFISYFLNGDIPTILAFIGILLVGSGIYLNNRPENSKVLDPFKLIWKNKGARQMTFVAILWACTSSLHTVAIAHSDAYTYVGIGIPVLAFVMTMIVLFTRRKETIFAFKTLPTTQLIKIGVFDGITLLAQMIGQGMVQAAYLISIKRLSMVISAFMAKKYFGEDISNRILPISMVAIGVILIILGK